MQEYDLYTALEAIRVRTGMYIGGPTLELVGSYISGYDQAMRDAGVKDVTCPDLVHFRAWLKKKFGFPSDTAGWMNMVLALALGCDPSKPLSLSKLEKATHEQHLKSVELFYELLDAFRNDKSVPTEPV